MCENSLQMVQSRPAAVGERLVTRNFGGGTRGFCPVDNPDVAVCVRPGTELAFVRPIESGEGVRAHATAIFRQVNKDIPRTHHDANGILEEMQNRLFLAAGFDGLGARGQDYRRE
jgi:hypothetical protein